ncbi:DUF418 domain-containing protein [Actinomadura rugatobispora]|uniref:DUF418 domain-containing protein n=1 Tax=Actinomadura rugatobispora TaxID=1994 RepID=A0ABW1A1C9_9ACTN|nr:DUF418 domain-containing protein [Actinomadura rugatobispora]
MSTVKDAEGGPVRPERRIAELDALRGFALCGIIFINIPQTLEMFDDAGQLPGVLRVFFFGRFYPIFFLLFGIGFGLFLRSARRNGLRPRVLLLRRFAALGFVGVLLHLLQPGEVLLPFAVTGVLVLLPLSYVEGWAVLAHGSVLTAAGVFVGAGGIALLPGLFALGFVLAELDVPATLRRRTGQLLALGAGAAVTGALAWWLTVLDLPDAARLRLGMLIPLSMAAGYMVLFLLALRTPAGPALSRTLAPLGRMTLTNYVTAALLFVPIGGALGLRHSTEWGLAALLGFGILAVQAVFSHLWLGTFRHGPLEWAWRCVTYWRRLPISR